MFLILLPVGTYGTPIPTNYHFFLQFNFLSLLSPVQFSLLIFFTSLHPQFFYRYIYSEEYLRQFIFLSFLLSLLSFSLFFFLISSLTFFLISSFFFSFSFFYSSILQMESKKVGKRNTWNSSRSISSPRTSLILMSAHLKTLTFLAFLHFFLSFLPLFFRYFFSLPEES